MIYRPSGADAAVDLAQRVLRDGRLLVDRGHAERVRFEVKTRMEFWDLEPYLKQYRRTQVVRGSSQR
jgi:hypothetical protein